MCQPAHGAPTWWTARVRHEPFTWKDALNRMLRVFTQRICAYDSAYRSVAVTGLSPYGMSGDHCTDDPYMRA